MRSLSASLFVTALLASGCAGARWSIASTRPVATVVVAPARVVGTCNPKVVVAQRNTLIANLRARGYDVVDGEGKPGLPRVQLTFAGKLIDDSMMHAPDDDRHHIYNDLHYVFTAYQVNLDLVDGNGQVVAHGLAESDGDPAKAVRALTARFVHDIPPVSAALASR